jgi:hypothetical protein
MNPVRTSPVARRAKKSDRLGVSRSRSWHSVEVDPDALLSSRMTVPYLFFAGVELAKTNPSLALVTLAVRVRVAVLDGVWWPILVSLGSKSDRSCNMRPA